MALGIVMISGAVLAAGALGPAREGEEGGYEHMSSGGMGEVQTNLSHLPEVDTLAIATYLATLK